MQKLITLVFAFALVPAPALGQRDTTRAPPGIELAAQYQSRTQPLISVKPITAAVDMVFTAEQVAAILRTDLDYSDRFRVFATPADLASGPVDYRAWNGLNVTYVVESTLETAAGGGSRLSLTVHDVVYGQAKPTRFYPLPAATDDGFRLAVHAVSDDIVQSVLGQPGMAASRVAFVRRGRNGSELMVIDYDGENLEQVATSTSLIYSPAWAPDGQRIAYTVQDDGWRLIEYDFRTGRSRRITTPNTNLLMTPAYSADGTRIGYAANIGDRLELFESEIASGRFQRMTTGPGYSMSPTYSPDGQRIAFNSTRLGNPHIYVMPAAGGAATLLTPYVSGQRGYYTSPEWAPSGTQITFHGHWNSRGTYQVFVADANRPLSQIRQLTSQGSNEDPSWAPDARHIVYTQTGAGGDGLYVIDIPTGRRRELARGAGNRIADWSPALARAGLIGTN